MKAVMLSVAPKWVDKICHEIGVQNGKPIYEKEDEVRKTRPKTLVPFKVLIYESRRRKKVVAEFICDLITALKADNMIQAYYSNTKKTCLTDAELLSYAKGGKVYFWHISDLKIYEKPMELSEFIVPSKFGCVNEGKCRGCRFFDRGNGFNVEDDCSAPFCTDDFKPLREAPQSWCYVEEVK